MSLLAALIGYVIGSMPTAGLLGRLWGVDLLGEGSGNPGTANALRTSGARLAATVLVVEAAKGYAAVLAGSSIAGETGAMAAGLGAVAGNVYNVWYHFGGGKGLGISLGVLAAAWPAALVPVLVVLVGAVLISRSSDRPTRRALGRDGPRPHQEALARFPVQQILPSRTSISSVTGPSLTMSTVILAPKTP
jgi:glycerol-3-phosphate acyltransferase PlsY